MNQVTVLDKTFQLSIPHDQILTAVARIAKELDKDFHGKDPLFLAVLNGSFIFASDLFKMLTVPCSISFIKMASYSGEKSSGQVNELIGLTENLKGRHVVILEDIVDSGLTMKVLLQKLEERSPASITIASLLFKPDAFKADFQIDYLGMSIPNDFIVGYGLDYNGYGRNLKNIYTVLP